MRRPAPSRLLLVAALSALCWGASPGQDDRKDEPLAEEVRINLVQVPVLATDRQGRPVTDLTADEIVVKDGGRRLSVSFLDPFATAGPVAPADPDIRLTLDLPDDGPVTATAATRPARYLVLFIDVENDDALQRPDAAEQVARTVRQQWRDGDRMAVFSSARGLNLETSFTEYPETATAAVRSAYARLPRPRTEIVPATRLLIQQLETCRVSGSSAIDEGCLRGVIQQEMDQVRMAADDYLEALEGVISFAAGLRRRVTVIALSHGVPFDASMALGEALRATFGNTEQTGRLQLELVGGDDAGQRAERLMERAVRDQVTVHVIDRNRRPPGIGGARQGRMLEPGFRPVQAAHEAPQADLDEMAARTGGVFRRAPGEPGAELGRVIDLERGGYLLGFTTGERLAERRLGKVRVRCTRRGVRLLYRRGIYRRPEAEPGDLPGGLLLGNALAPSPDERLHFLPYTLELAPATLGYRRDGGEMTTAFTVQVRLEDANGVLLAEVFRPVRHAYSWFLWERGEIEPVLLSGWAEIPPGVYRLVASVQSPASGRHGTFTRELRVAAP